MAGTDITKQIIKGALRGNSIATYQDVANKIEEFGAEFGGRFDGNGMAKALAYMCRAIASHLEASAEKDGISIIGRDGS